MSKVVKLATTDEMANQSAKCIEVDGEKVALWRERRSPAPGMARSST